MTSSPFRSRIIRTCIHYSLFHLRGGVRHEKDGSSAVSGLFYYRRNACCGVSGGHQEGGLPFPVKSPLYNERHGLYWYDKANGGLETLTGIPYSSPKLDCLNCHVKSCDVCHKTAEGDKLSYKAATAKNQEVCLQCHKREKTIMKIDHDANQADVHFAGRCSAWIVIEEEKCTVTEQNTIQ